MPTHRIHLIGGAATYLLVSYGAKTIFPWINNSFLIHFICFCFCLLGSIFPDIDTSSKMQRVCFAGLFIIAPFALYKNTSVFLGLTLLSGLLIVSQHRSITHNLVFLFVMPLSIAWLLALYKPTHAQVIFSICTYFSCGALSHRLLDLGPRRFISLK